MARAPEMSRDGRTPRRRRWGLIAAGGVLGLVVVVALVGLAFYGRIGAWAVRTKVVPRLEARIGRPIELGEVEVEHGRVILHDLVVRGDGDGDEPLVRVERITVDFDFWASLVGTVELGAAQLEGLRVTAVRRADDANYSTLLAALRGQPGGGAASGTGGRLRPTQVEVLDAHLELRDERGAVTLIAEGVSGRAVPGGEATASVGALAAITALGPYASLEAVEVSAQLDDPLATAVVVIGGGQLDLWRGMALTGVRGSIGQGARAGVLDIDLTGGYAGVDGQLWHARGSVDPRAEKGDVKLAADRFTFARIAPVLEGSAVIDYQDTSMDAVLDVHLDGDVVSVTGEFDVSGLNLFHPKLADEPMRGLAGHGALTARYRRRSRTVEIDEARVATGGVEYILKARVEEVGPRQPGDAWLQGRHVSAELIVPEVGCQAMLASIPPEFVPHLQGFALKGKFATDIVLDVDWRDLEAARLDGSVGIRGCKVVRPPEDMDPERLKGTFEHEVEIAEGEWATMQIGPESEDYVPLAEVSPHLINSLMTTEDSAFYKHKGFIVREFRTALIKDLEAGYFKYGASSITMQTVKNVFLSRQKTLGRKLQELFLTWYLEQVLDKDRILEIYVNAIEYGPGLYGIKPAALQYFGKPPAELSPSEAAFFSSILPAPKKRYVQFCKGALSSWTETKIKRILELMVQRDRLSPAEFEVAMATPLLFQPDKREFCTRKWSKK